MSGTVYVKGLDNIVINLKNLNPGQDPHFKEVCDQTAGIILGAVQKKASLTDHDLQELAQYHQFGKGHIGAYSAKMGTDSGPHPDDQVHIQDGTLYNAIKSEVAITDTKVTISVSVSESDAPYVKYLIHGTSKMRPRDFLGHAWVEVKAKAVSMLKSGIAIGRKSR